MDYSNSLFYTFSTIAQTLAGAIALLGAFILYRLASLNQDMRECADTISEKLNDAINQADIYVQGRQCARRQQYQELLEISARGKYSPNYSHNPSHERERLSEMLQVKESLLTNFKIALRLTVFSLLFSVGVLPFAQIIGQCYQASIAFLAVGVGSFIGSIMSYVPLIQKAVGD
jgi:hypothetical protein